MLFGLRSPNNERVWSLYVTDYTRNPIAPPVKGDWCPPRLSALVIKIELWNAAAAIGCTMKPGEFYDMQNVRFKYSDRGELEGTFSEVPKLRKLDQDAMENEADFENLLEYVLHICI